MINSAKFHHQSDRGLFFLQSLSIAFIFFCTKASLAGPTEEESLNKADSNNTVEAGSLKPSAAVDEGPKIL